MLVSSLSISISREGAIAIICVTALLIILLNIFSVYRVRMIPTLLRIIIYSLMAFVVFSAIGTAWINWFYGLVGFSILSNLFEIVYNFWRCRSVAIEDEQTPEQTQVAQNQIVLNLVTVVGNEDDVNNREDNDDEGSNVDDPQPNSKLSAKRVQAVHPLREPQPPELTNAPMRDSL